MAGVGCVIWLLFIIERIGKTEAGPITFQQHSNDGYRSHCPVGYAPFQGFCFKLFTEKKNFEDAEETCNDDGGHLAAYHSQQVFDHLVSLKPSSSNVWVGARGPPYFFTDGSSHDYQEPGEFLDAWCIRIMDNEKMDGRPCTQQKPYICMYKGSCAGAGDEFEGHCYVIHAAPVLRFNLAEEQCNELYPDGHLATYHSQDAVDFLLEISSAYIDIWIGLKAQAEFSFTDGTDFDFSVSGEVLYAPWVIIYTNNKPRSEAKHIENKFICMLPAVDFAVSMEASDLLTFDELFHEDPTRCLDTAKLLHLAFHYKFTIHFDEDNVNNRTIAVKVTWDSSIRCDNRRVLYEKRNKAICFEVEYWSCSLRPSETELTSTCVFECPCNSAADCEVVFLDLAEAYYEDSANACGLELV